MLTLIDLQWLKLTFKQQNWTFLESEQAICNHKKQCFKKLFGPPDLKKKNTMKLFLYLATTF
jgi:hypothetical protein